MRQLDEDVSEFTVLANILATYYVGAREGYHSGASVVQEDTFPNAGSAL